ncbi:MAG: ABC transporter substrate-binding protein [Ectobacillus sp.]
MKGRKLLATLGVSSLLVGGILAGCSNDTKETKAKDGEKVEITLSGWGASPEESNLLKQTLADFEKKYPNIKVKHDVIADQYMDVIKTRLIGNEAADVFYLDSLEAPALMEQNVLEPLDEYIKKEKDFDMEDFEKSMLEAFQSKSVTYGLPKGYSTLGLFYNKKMLQEAGVEVPKTMEEFREAAKKLTKGTERYGFGVAPDLARMYYMPKAYGTDAVKDDKANLSDKGVVEAIQPIIDMKLQDKSIAQPKDVGANWGGEMFGQEKVAMVMEGNWAIPFLKDNFPNLDYGIAELPTVNGKPGTMAFTVAYVMNKNSEKKDAAWKLISYLTGKEGMKTWTSKGFELPTRKSVATELGFDKDPLRSAFVAGAPYATVWQAGPNLPTIKTNFDNQFISAFLGQKPLDKALQEAEKTANKEIKAQQ